MYLGAYIHIYIYICIFIYIQVSIGHHHGNHQHIDGHWFALPTWELLRQAILKGCENCPIENGASGAQKTQHAGLTCES